MILGNYKKYIELTEKKDKNKVRLLKSMTSPLVIDSIDGAEI